MDQHDKKEIRPSQSMAAIVLMTSAALVIVIAGIREAQTIVVPFLLSLFLAVLLARPLFWLRDHGLRTSFALLLVISILVVSGILLVGLIGRSLDQFIKQIPNYETQLVALNNRVTKWLVEKELISEVGMTIPYINPESFVPLFTSLLSSLSGLFKHFVMILFFVSFMLMEAPELSTRLKAMPGNVERRVNFFTEVLLSIRHYMAIKTFTSIVTGLLIGISMYYLNMNYPLIWGVLAFALNYIPSIGSFMAALPAIALALIQSGPGLAFVVALVFLAVNVVIGNLWEPRLMGEGLGLSILVVFLSLVFWGWVLGPIGMLLGVPLTKCLKVTLEHDDKTKWLAILLGKTPSAS